MTKGLRPALARALAHAERALEPAPALRRKAAERARVLQWARSVQIAWLVPRPAGLGHGMRKPQRAP